MRLLILAALIAITSSCQCDIERELEYGFCEGANQPLTIDELAVEPYPPELYSGAIIQLDLGITLHEPIPIGSTVSFEVVKGLLDGLPLPCIEYEEFKFGSW
jgi:hypothetical protein